MHRHQIRHHHRHMVSETLVPYLLWQPLLIVLTVLQHPQSQLTGWEAVEKAINDFDTAQVAIYKDDIDTLLVFVSIIVIFNLMRSFSPCKISRMDCSLLP